MTVGEPDLARLLQVDVASARATVGGRRVVMIGLEASAALRELLVDTLGENIARGILTRWGYQNAIADARVQTRLNGEQSPEEWAEHGCRRHAAVGIVRMEIDELRVDWPAGTMLLRGRLRNCAEAEEHLTVFGRAQRPACWSVIGYVSGWATSYMGSRMVAVEEACAACGDAECRFVVRPLAEWGEEARSVVQALEREHPIRLLEERIEEKRRELREKNEALEKTARDLEASNHKLRELDRVKTDFFANISHEFRTPLTLNLGPLEELLATSHPPAETRQLELMYRNSLRLLRLVNNLLDFAQVEAGKLRAAYRPVDLATATREIAAGFESAFKARGLDLTLALEAEAPAYVDREMWEKIVSNLLSNALKFTARGGATVKLQRTASAFVLEVIDTGPGIAAEQAEQIFTRFHRGGNGLARNQEGAGLGLPLAAELCRLHGGTLTVESTPGAGAAFRVAVPMGKDHLPADRVLEEPAEPACGRAGEPSAAALALASESAVPMPAPERDSGPRERVLIVEDNEDLRVYLANLLRPRFEVELAADGAEGLERARGSLPALVLTDLMMPRMDGLELCERLKFDPLTASIPVVILTARAELGEKLKGLEIGADDYVLKPFNPRELLARLAAQVSLRRAQRQLATYATELERLVEEQVGEIRRQNRELELAQREMEDFLFIASHDLQAPLVTLAGYAHLLHTRLTSHLQPAEARAFERIQLAVKAMQALIESLLTLARVRHREPEQRKLDLREIIGAVVDQLGPNFEETQSQVVVGELPKVCYGDPTHISQVLRNLIENAVKYRDESRPLRIEVGCREDQGAATLYVRDNGVGIPVDLHHLLFRPLSRLDQAKQVGGTGMGLYIVRKIAESHGGRAWVESAPGIGSTFHVRLPNVRGGARR